MTYKIPISTTTLTRNIRIVCALIFSSKFKILYVPGQSGKSPDGNTPNIITYRRGNKVSKPIAQGARDEESKRQKEGRRLAGRKGRKEGGKD